MATLATPTLADLFPRVGDVPAERIIMDPAPGTATYADAIRFAERSDGPACEWIDGVLVEKAMGARESSIASELLLMLNAFDPARRFGRVFADAFLLDLGGQFRVPDLLYYASERRALLSSPLPAVVRVMPDLVVEVLSVGNTRSEMDRKRQDYFGAGVRVVWEIDPVDRTIGVWTDGEASRTLTETDTLDGGDVLPGFAVAVAEVLNGERP